MEHNLRNALPGAVDFTTVTARGSPYGSQVTKARGTVVADRWSGRVESVRAFLSLVGTPGVLARIWVIVTETFKPLHGLIRCALFFFSSMLYLTH